MTEHPLYGVESPDRLATLKRTGLLDSSPEEAFDRLARLAVRLLKVPIVLISLVDEDRQFFKSHIGLPEPWASASQTSLAHSFCQYVVATAGPLVVTDARVHPLVGENRAIDELGVIAYAGVPLLTLEGHVLGAFCAIDSHPHDWADEELCILRDLAASVMTEIELRLAAQAARRQAEEMATLLESTGEGIFGIDRDGNCTFVNRKAAELLGYLPGELIGKNLHPLCHQTRLDGSFDPEEECPIYRVFRTGQGCRVDDEVMWRRDGSSFAAEYSAYPIRDGDGIKGAVVTVIDISTRKQAEMQLKADLEREHHIAETLQLALLPTIPEDTFPGLRVVTLYQAALAEAQVGGDFHDAFLLADGKVALVVGDASGKGLSAATRTAEIRYALRAFLREYPHPSRAVARLNDFVCAAQSLDETAEEAFTVLCLAVVDAANGQAMFVSAGSEPPLIVRSDGVIEAITEGGPVVGFEPRQEYPIFRTHLAPGDTLLMITDGITEARQGREFLGYEGMIRLVEKAREAKALRAMGQAILDDTYAFGGGSLRDDACLLLAALR